MDKILERLSHYAVTEADKPLRTLTTLRIGGNAKYVVYPDTLMVMILLQKQDVPSLLYQQQR